MIEGQCVVYSMGSNGNMAFEAAVLDARPDCEVHVFDEDNYGLEEWFPDAKTRKQVTFHRYFVSHVEDTKQNPPRRTLHSIMRELGHVHVDILKMDIEGAEIDLLSHGALPSIGQLQVEVHLGNVPQANQLDTYTKMFRSLESCGLRLFHKEANARYGADCVELAFIQKRWRPNIKHYPCAQ